MEAYHEIEMSFEGGDKTKDDYIKEMQSKLDAVEKQIQDNAKAQKILKQKEIVEKEKQFYYQPKGQVVNPRAQAAEVAQSPKKKIMKPVTREIGAAQDDKILNMQRPLTAERLNLMFTEK